MCWTLEGTQYILIYWSLFQSQIPLFKVSAWKLAQDIYNSCFFTPYNFEIERQKNLSWCSKSLSYFMLMPKKGNKCPKYVGCDWAAINYFTGSIYSKQCTAYHLTNTKKAHLQKQPISIKSTGNVHTHTHILN